MGDLLRAVACAYSEWEWAEQFNAVTDGESQRMERVAFSALALYEAWIREQ